MFGLPVVVTQEATARFWVKVAMGQPNECWPWQAYRDRKSGYGKFTTKYPVNVAAHRYAYATVHGDPGELIVRHTCDNRRCCNPAHLVIGTHQDNMDDMVSRGRHVGTREITEEAAVEIRVKRAAGAMAKDLALDYELSPQHISNICTGKYWPKAGGPLTVTRRSRQREATP